MEQKSNANSKEGLDPFRFILKQVLKLKFFTYKALGLKKIKRTYAWGQLFVNFDWIGQNIFFGNFENTELLILSNFINDNSIIIDVGANIGFHTVFFSSKAKKGGVFSFEPSSREFETLSKNIDLNNLLNVKAIKAALGNKSGQEKIYINNTNYGTNSLVSVLAENEANYELVDIMTLDEFAFSQNLTALDLIKIDVEGFELEVLIGATKVLEKYKPIIFFESWKSYKKGFAPDLTNEIKFLLDLGYSMYAFNFKTLYKLEDDMEVLSKDIVAVPKGFTFQIND